MYFLSLQFEDNMYHIVEFLDEEGVEVVPASWVQDGMSFWPPYDNTNRCIRAVVHEDPPDESWNTYRVRIMTTKGML